MAGYATDIEEMTETNEYFRKVLYTAQHMQLVIMTLQVGEEIGLERHDHVDQFFRVEEGEAEAVLDGQAQTLREGHVLIVPAGTTHNVRNASPVEPLRLYTVYSPPNHPDGTIHKTKAEATAAEAAHH